jgi:hypothetical protein
VIDGAKGGGGPGYRPRRAQRTNRGVGTPTVRPGIVEQRIQPGICQLGMRRNRPPSGRNHARHARIGQRQLQRLPAH